jgi:malonyl CoA-acyl carrier protein transacylase/phosphopantetheinyl transferase
MTCSQVDEQACVGITGCGAWLTTSRGVDGFWDVECGIAEYCSPCAPGDQVGLIELILETISDALEDAKLGARSVEGKRVVLIAGIEGSSWSADFVPWLTRHLHVFTSVIPHVGTGAADPILRLQEAIELIRNGQADVVLLSICDVARYDRATTGAISIVLEPHPSTIKSKELAHMLLRAGNLRDNLHSLAFASFIYFHGNQKRFGSYVEETVRDSAVEARLKSKEMVGDFPDLEHAKSRSNHPLSGFLKTMIAAKRGTFPLASGLSIGGRVFGALSCVRPWFGSDRKGTRVAAVVYENPSGDPLVLIFRAIGQCCLEGARDRRKQLYVFSAESPERLASRLETLATEGNNGTLTPEILAIEKHSEWRAALVAETSKEAMELALDASKRIRENPEMSFVLRSGTSYSGKPGPEKMALMFPGQGAQFFRMNEEVLLAFPQYRTLVEAWNASQTVPGERAPAEWIYPLEINRDEANRRSYMERITSIECGGQATFISCLAMCRLLTSLGIEPDCMVGNSQGEICALIAAGIFRISDAEIMAVLAQMKHIIRSVNTPRRGDVLAVTVRDRKPIFELIDKFQGKLFLALDNCPQQLILFACSDVVDAVVSAIHRCGGLVLKLPFNSPSHTPLFKEESSKFAALFNNIIFSSGRVPVYSCVSASPFPDDPPSAGFISGKLWHKPVLFRQTVERMYSDGVRIFVDVGPGAKLAGYVADTLRGRAHWTCSVSSDRDFSNAQFIGALGFLFTRGQLDPSRLYPQSCAPRAIVSKNLHEISIVKTSPTASAGIRHGPNIQITGEHNSDVPNVQILKTHFDLMCEFLQSQQRVAAWLSHCLSDCQSLAAVDQSHTTDRFINIGDEVCLQNPREEEGMMAWDCKIDLQKHPFLRDHTFGRTVSPNRPELLSLPIVPFAFSLKLALEAAAACMKNPQGAVRFINCRAFRWLTADYGKFCFRVVAKPLTLPDVNSTACRVTFENVNHQAGSMPLFETELHFVPRYDNDNTSTMPPVPPSTTVWSARDYYHYCSFHGDSFKVIRRIIGRSGDLLEVQLQRQIDSESADFPAEIIDAFGQIGSYWLVEVTGIRDYGVFPVSVAELKLFQKVFKKGTLFCCRAACVKRNDELYVQIELLAADGSLAASVRDYRMRIFPWPTRYMTSIYLPTSHSEFTLPVSLVTTDRIVLRSVDVREHPQLESAGDIWSRGLAFMSLGAREREFWLGFKASRMRKLEWLLARVAAKDAVREWARRVYELPVFPADIEILPDAHGKPTVHCREVEALGPVPNVSIAHSNGRVFAAASDHQTPVGLDFECTDRPGGDEKLASAFAPEEQSLMKDKISPLAGWVCKEAAAKAAGIGLAGVPLNWRLTCQHNGQWVIKSSHGDFSVSLTRLKSGWLGLASKRK